MQQTICRNLRNIWRWILRESTADIFNLQNTKNISNLLNSFLVKISVIIRNPQITKAHVVLLLHRSSLINVWLSMLVGISEAIRLLLVNFIILFSSSNNKFIRFISLTKSAKFTNINTSLRRYSDNSSAFNEWLAGLIDGDGCFQLSKKGYASLEIVMELRDKHCLYQVKDKFGGAVKLRAGNNHLRYRLHNKEGLLKLIYAVNGLIRNPTRLFQLNKICDKYGIDLIQPLPLNYNNGWLSGFLDSDGSIYLNLQSDQLFISISQKNKLLLDPLIDLYGGSIYVLKTAEAFKWTVYKKEEIKKLLDYFNKYPLRSAKLNRIKLISKYFELRNLKAHRATETSVLGKSWKYFINKWTNYN